jgi:putative peptidoglycan lipid II flippase
MSEKDSIQSAEKKSLLKAAMSMSVITMVSRVLGLIREQVRAHYLGTSMGSDAFGIAFQIPNLLRRLLAEGAMSAGFIPVLSEYRAKEGDAKALSFARNFFNLSLLLMVVVSGLGALCAGLIVNLFALLGGESIAPEKLALTTELTQWMFPYIALVSWAAVAQGILNTFKIFWVSASTAILLNIAIIGAALILASGMEQPAFAFVIGVLIGGIVQFGFQIPFVFRLGFRWKPDFRISPGVKRVLVLLVPTVIGAGVYQINVLVSQAIAWGVGDGAVSSLQYSSRLLELTLGVFAVALSTVILPALATHVANAQTEKVQNTIGFSIRLTCFVCFPVTAGLWLTRQETIQLLFERGTFDALSTNMTAYALNFHIIGLTFIALSRIFVPVFYAYKDTWRPLFAAAVSMLINIAACYALAPHLKQGGIALANTLSALAHLLVLIVLMRHHVRVSIDTPTVKSLSRSLFATGVMAVVVIFLQNQFQTAHLENFGALVIPYTILVAIAVCVFALACAMVRHPELKEIIGLVRRRRRSH